MSIGRGMHEMKMDRSVKPSKIQCPRSRSVAGLLSKWLLPGVMAFSMAACGGEYSVDGIDPVDETMDVESTDSAMSKSSWKFAHNAEVKGDFFYVRDGRGRTLKGRRVDDGDPIVVLDVGYTSQLTLVQYPSSNGPRMGFIKNVPSLIRYYSQDKWLNGSTPETVYDLNGKKIGMLNPYEKATPLYISPFNRKMFHVVYDTDKGPNTKSGYVKYHGNYPTFKNASQPPIGPHYPGGSVSQPGSSTSSSTGGLTMDDLITLGKDLLDVAGSFIDGLPPVLLPIPILEKALNNGQPSCPLQ